MPRCYDLTVTLDDVQPPVWRRFLLAADATAADLHRAIQDACGWENSHLFEFTSPDGARLAGLPDQDWDEVSVADATVVPLPALFADDEICRYVYDFGDHWEHTVRCHGVVDVEERVHRRLLGGNRAFPPEDCGGFPGYEQCVEIVQGGEDPDGIRDWIGSWDPEDFDLAAARAAFDTDERPGGPASPYIRPGFPPPTSVRVAPTQNASAEGLRAAAEAVELLDRLARFTSWAGTPRKLTGTGNLTRASGAELIDLLGTDDRLDEQIGDRVFKTKSTTELREVDLVFRLARRAGFVKVRHDAVSATRRGERVGRDPVADWHAAFRGLLELGVLQHRYAHATRRDPYWKELLDGQVVGLLASLLLAGGPVPIAELAERLWQLVEASFVLDDLDAEERRRHREHLEDDVRRICAAFAALGAIELTDVETVTTIHGFEREHGGRVALTALGAQAVRVLTQP
jgi:hypothetical protein